MSTHGKPLDVNAEWLAQYAEDVIDPALPIVDPHHHLWHRPDGRYLVEDFAEDIRSGHNIVSTVYIQARSMYRKDAPKALQSIGETEFAAGCAAMSESGAYGSAHICEGIVGFAELRLGAAVEEILTAHKIAAGGRFRGIRYSTTWDSDPTIPNPAHVAPPHLLLDATFREGFAKLGPMGLSFDSWLFHTQLEELLDLARAFPDTPIIINHVGGPVGLGRFAGRRKEILQTMRPVMRALASCPNVALKLGGLAMRVMGTEFHRQPKPPTSTQVAEHYLPFVDLGLELFGSERCMFESNFPVEKASVSYVVLWNAFKRLTANFSDGERADLFSRTAARVYRLDIDN